MLENILGFLNKNGSHIPLPLGQRKKYLRGNGESELWNFDSIKKNYDKRL